MVEGIVANAAVSISQFPQAALGILVYCDYLKAKSSL
jgi:hypothetical protein